MRLGVVRGISYGVRKPPDEWVPQARAIGAGLVRFHVCWNQVEPEPRKYDWTAVDALLALLEDEEVWLTVCASSTWATRSKTTFLPPSPPEDPEQYATFVRKLVERCGGRITYWQCENELGNGRLHLLWAGTAEEYVAHLKTMHAMVKKADPNATVVLGGCGYDFLSSPPDSKPRAFFDHVLDAGRDSFDLFDVHLYSDPVPAHLDDVRAAMRRHGYEKPLVAGEIGGPVPFDYPVVRPVVYEMLWAAMTTGERERIERLYRREDVHDDVRMFLIDCPPELEDRRHRIACRQLVTRTLLALAGGVRRTFYWHLAPEIPGGFDRGNFGTLVFGKLNLLAYEGTALTHRNPAADAFERLARALKNVTSVTSVDDHAVRLDLDTMVVWGPSAEPEPADLAWNAPTARAEDVFGSPVRVEVRDGRVYLDRSENPVFITV